MLEQQLRGQRKVYIVGAQSRAKTLTGYLNVLYPAIVIQAYLVDASDDNDSDIKGVPVCKLEECEKFERQLPVFIATKGIYHDEITVKLKECGFENIIPVNVELDNRLRNAYVEKIFEKEKRTFQKLEQLEAKAEQYISVNQGVCIYMAKSVYDKPLQQEYRCPAYEKPIQVGAALTETRMDECTLTDCEGDNISLKNRQYCELTALYWMWKHAKEDIIGLSHYRRHFVLPENWQMLMEQYDIDVILPVPTFVAPNIADNYKERHDASDWEYLMQYLKEHLPDDYELSHKVYGGNLYSPCNMFIMKKEILHELCSWMFPILDAVTEHGGEKEDTYLNRYAGFISERLLTLFFEKNRDRFHIVYADKSFLM